MRASTVSASANRSFSLALAAAIAESSIRVISAMASRSRSCIASTCAFQAVKACASPSRIEPAVWAVSSFRLTRRSRRLSMAASRSRAASASVSANSLRSRSNRERIEARASTSRLSSSPRNASLFARNSAKRCSAIVPSCSARSDNSSRAASTRFRNEPTCRSLAIPNSLSRSNPAISSSSWRCASRPAPPIWFETSLAEVEMTGRLSRSRSIFSKAVTLTRAMASTCSPLSLISDCRRSACSDRRSVAMRPR